MALYVFDRDENWAMITGKWGGRLHCRMRMATAELSKVYEALDGRMVALECKDDRDSLVILFSKRDDWHEQSSLLIEELTRMHEDQTEHEITPDQVSPLPTSPSLHPPSPQLPPLPSITSITES